MPSVVNEHLTARPAAPLTGLVAAYSGYRQRGVAPALHRGLPSPYLTLIFTIDEPLQIAAHVDKHQAPGDYDALLGGLHLTPAYIRHDGAQSGVQVHLSPLAARALLGLPAGELAGIDFSADVLLGSVVDEVRDGLRRAADWPSRFAAIDRALLRHARSAQDIPAEVRFAWNRLLCTGGTVGVADLVAETGCSDRHLANMMRRETGLTPKRAARVIRFDRARRALQRAGGQQLAEVAATCGYVDQSHMSRDFVAMADNPPARWLSAEFGH